MNAPSQNLNEELDQRDNQAESNPNAQNASQIRSDNNIVRADDKITKRNHIFLVVISALHAIGHSVTYLVFRIATSQIDEFDALCADMIQYSNELMIIKKFLGLFFVACFLIGIPIGCLKVRILFIIYIIVVILTMIFSYCYDLKTLFTFIPLMFKVERCGYLKSLAIVWSMMNYFYLFCVCIGICYIFIIRSFITSERMRRNVDQ